MPSPHRLLLGCALVAGLAASAPAGAGAATIQVDDDGAQCPAAVHASIQSAVDAAGPGDTVVVCNGTYPGGVRIVGPERSGLRLRAKMTGGATITGFGTDTDPHGVYVQGAFGVEVSRFVIEGPTTSDVFERNGIYVQIESGASLIRNNRVSGRLTAAINVAGEARDVSLNHLSGFDQAGIALSGTVPTVTRNTTFSTSPFAAGIYVFGQNTDVTSVVSGNRTSSDGHGVGYFVENAIDDAIALRHNAARNHEWGILVNDSSGVRFEFNAVTDNRIGIQADASAFGNRFDHNVARRNAEFDCRDSGALDNVWIANDGFRSEPSSICRPRR